MQNTIKRHANGREELSKRSSKNAMIYSEARPKSKFPAGEQERSHMKRLENMVLRNKIQLLEHVCFSPVIDHTNGEEMSVVSLSFSLVWPLVSNPIKENHSTLAVYQAVKMPRVWTAPVSSHTQNSVLALAPLNAKCECLCISNSL